MKTVAWSLAAPLCLFALSAYACPEINGTFESREGAITRSVQLHTQRSGDAVAYRLGTSELLPADGAAHEATTDSHAGRVSVSCDDTSVTIRGIANGGNAVVTKISRLDERKIRVATDGGASGEYALARD